MTQYITIKDASDMSGKSVQTIRRMIKSKKIKYRKDRTPQGFNYLIDLQSLIETCKLSAELVKAKLSLISQDAIVTDNSVQTQSVKALDLDVETPEVSETSTRTVVTEAAPIATSTSTIEENSLAVAPLDRSHQKIVSYEPIKEFNDTMQKLIEQHGKEKENLFRLVETFQNKVISLENKLKVETSAKKSWFKIW